MLLLKRVTTRDSQVREIGYSCTHEQIIEHSPYDSQAQVLVHNACVYVSREAYCTCLLMLFRAKKLGTAVQ